MELICTNLVPRYEEKGTIILDELDEVNEIIFVSKGLVDVGFRINNVPNFVV